LRAAASPAAEPLDEEAVRLEQWLLEGRHGTMDWMERRFEKRTDPTKLVDGAETVISVLHNDYQPGAASPAPQAESA
jgi:epoxyqueuosine reductase